MKRFDIFQADIILLALLVLGLLSYGLWEMAYAMFDV